MEMRIGGNHMDDRYSGGVYAAIVLVVFAGLCINVAPAQTETKAQTKKAVHQDECDQLPKSGAAQSMHMNMDEGGMRGMFMLNATTDPMPVVCLTRYDPFKPPAYRDIGTPPGKVPGSPEIQQFFNQGLQFYYAFNNRESYRAFRYAASEASKVTPSCAMCFVGQALALGPDINMSKELEPDRQAGKRALADADKALQNDLSRRTITPEEGAEIKTLIDALKLRLQDCPLSPPQDFDCQSWRNNNYQAAIAAQFDKYRNDPDYVIWFADAAMNQTPWGYWLPDGKPKSPAIAQSQAAIEAALKPNPNHNGLIHWYIHLMEMSGNPQLALDGAQKLANLAPKAGHLVHMPSHIYYRLGNMGSAIGANVAAVATDQYYFDHEDVHRPRPDGDRYRFGYYPHNMHFELAAAVLTGRGDIVVDVAKALLQSAPGKPTGYRADRYRADYYLGQLNFITPIEIKSFPRPQPGQPLSAVAYDYSQIVADILRGNTQSAESNYQKLQQAARAYPVDPSEKNPQCDPTQKRPGDLNLCVIQIMLNVGRAQIDARGPKDSKVIFDSMNKAITIQDGLPYGEPPAWLYPVRQTLAGLMVWRFSRARTDKASLSQAMSRLKESLPDDSKSGRPIPPGVFPGNGWAYFGLWKMAEILSPPDARQYEQKYRELWKASSDPEFLRM